MVPVNNNPLENLPKRFLFCHEINQLLENMYGQGAQNPPIQIQHFVHSAFLLANFFKKYFERKKWRSGDELLLKNGTSDGFAY